MGCDDAYQDAPNRNIQKDKTLMPVSCLKYVGAIFVLIWVAIFLAISTLGWTDTWSAILIPTMSPPFADMRTVQGSLLTIEAGLNPQIDNPGDPWNRPMNYPSAWIWLAKYFHIQNEFNYLIFVALMVVGFLVSCFAMLRKYPSLSLLLACFSGSTLLAVERGNNDLVIFTLLLIAASSPRMFGVVMIMIATLLKIYPVLAIPAFLKDLRIVALMLIGSFLVVIFLLPQLTSIQSATPISGGLSYGSQSIFAHVKRFDSKTLGLILSALLIFIAIILSSKERFSSKLKTSQSGHSEEILFLIGSCIFIGTFVLASNSDYRLIFLLFCVPYLLKIGNSAVRVSSITSLIIAMNFLPLKVFLGEFGVGLNIAAKIFLFIFLLTTVISKQKVALEQIFFKFKFRR